ncbi:MAG: DUF502 domain-containing protein [Planctomycetaceae bacterium]|nr:DUF502 domain-containing protein [Planctomycetaceae bacterium]
MSKGAFSDTKKYFAAGFLLILPLFITLLILQFLFKIATGLFGPILLRFFPEAPIWLKVGVSLMIVFLVIFFLGVLTSHFLGRWFWNRFEQVLLQIPILRSIYSASREIVSIFHNPNRTGLKEAVLVDFPREGMKAIGFITGTIVNEHGVHCYRIFIPTTPNPTTGFLEIVPQSDVTHTNLTIEEAFRMIMSAGILGPEALVAAKATALTEPQPADGQ